jgi:putative tryptophan/tyrosine transport system substrate-binding protein
MKSGDMRRNVPGAGQMRPRTGNMPRAGGPMRRREFLVLACAAAWPLVAHAASADKPVIGFLHSGSRDQYGARLQAFLKGLSDAGFVDGVDVAIEYRWANGDNDKLPMLAADLIARQVAVIATVGSTSATVIAKAATSTIPIVFATGADPVELGFVASLNRPGGNITGVTSSNAELAGKWIGLSRELAPHAQRYFAVVNPASILGAVFTADLDAAAKASGSRLEILNASTEPEIEAAFAAFQQGDGEVLLFCPDPFFYAKRSWITALALSRRALTIFDDREYALAGGLLTYGADWSNLMALAGGYVARILKGEKPADLPVMRASKYELVINLKTAKSLGLDVPFTLLGGATEVIE